LRGGGAKTTPAAVMWKQDIKKLRTGGNQDLEKRIENSGGVGDYWVFQGGKEDPLGETKKFWKGQKEEEKKGTRETSGKKTMWTE